MRRRIALAELDGEQVAEVVARLTDRRLLTVGDGAVEVAHEALLREWPRLRSWLEEDVQGRRLHRRLGAAARAWDADGRDPGGLYRGARLASALEWAAGHQPELNATERAFLDDSRRASGREQRRLRLVLAGVASLLVIAVIAGLVALDQRGNARAEATAAAAQRLGAQALAEDDLDRALLLARQGVALHDSPQTRSSLLAALLKSPAAVGVLRGDGDRLAGVALSPDDRTLAVIDNDGTLRLVDTATRRPVAQPLTVSGMWRDGAWEGLSFSEDGSRFAVGGSQPVVLDARTHRVVARLPAMDGRSIEPLRLSADGRTLFAAVFVPPDRTAVRRFDATTGRPLGALRFVGRGIAPWALKFTSDGRVVTSRAGGPTTVRDARTLARVSELEQMPRPLVQLPAGGDQTALSPDDRTLLLGGPDGSVRFLDLATGKVRAASERHDGAVVRATISADGRTAVTAGEDRQRDRLERRAGRGTRDARRPRRRCHRTRDQPRRRDALHRRPGRHGPDLGPRRRPPPRPPVRRATAQRRRRAESPSVLRPLEQRPRLCPAPRRRGPRRRATRRDRLADRRRDAEGALAVPRGSERAGPWHGVRAGRAVARRRRRRRFPRHLRPGPRPSAHARCRATAAARC